MARQTDFSSGILQLPSTADEQVHCGENALFDRMQNVQVDIWHCNAAGIHSDIQSSTNGNGADYTSQTGYVAIN